LNTSGGSGTRTGYFLRPWDANAASSVARLPNMISMGPKPPSKLDTIQPINKPGMDAGIKAGRIVSTSENLI
jgi:hypothetical protein